MARVLTNQTGLAVARQDGFDDFTTSDGWKTLEPNGDITFGADIGTIARSPISPNRQRRKGTITDLDSEVSFGIDFTLDAAFDFIEGFCFSRAVGYDLVFRAADADSGTGDFTVSALSTNAGDVLQQSATTGTSLLWGAGYANDGNNGLHVLDADPAAAATALSVGGLTTETAPDNAELRYCGVRAATGDLALDVTSGVATLTSTNLDFTTLGLTVGQFIHIGGLETANQFDSAGSGVYGYGRITSLAANSVTLDKLSSTLVSDTGAGDTVDLLFGRFVRNVAVDDDDFLELYFLVEAYFPNLFETTPATPVANPDGFEYARNNLPNQLELVMAGQTKAELTVGMIGSDTDAPVNNASRLSGADSARDPLLTSAFNTTNDFARLRITDVDETGLTTDFTEMTLTLNNNVSGEKVIGFLGSKYLNTGNFDVSISSTVVFTEPNVIARIRNNTTVTMDFILENSDGAVIVDIPSMTLGGGGRDYALNESVKAELTGEAFQDATLGSSISWSFFPAVPNSQS